MKISSKLIIGFMAIISMQKPMWAINQKTVLLSMQPMSQEVISQSKNMMELLSEPFTTGRNGTTARIRFANSCIEQATGHAQMYLSLKKELLKSSSQKLSLFDYVLGIENLAGFNVQFINLWDHNSIFHGNLSLFKDKLACTKINGEKVCRVQLNDNAAKELRALSKNDLYHAYQEIAEILNRLTLLVGIYAVIYDEAKFDTQCRSLPINAFNNRNFSYRNIILILTGTARYFDRLALKHRPEF